MAILGITALLLVLPAHHLVAETVSTPETTAFSKWVAQYAMNTNRGVRPAMLADGVAAARQRMALVKSLIQTNPRAALTVSGQTTNVAQLPLEVRREMESRFATNGDFIVQGAVSAKGGPKVEPLRRFVRVGKQTFHAHVFGRRLGGVSLYDVPLSGIAVGEDAAVDEPAAPQTVQPNLPTAWTTGGKNILIIRVDFSDFPGAPEGYTAAQVQNIADSQVAPYYVASSYGLTSLTNTVTTTVYRMPQTAAYYAANGADYTLHADAESAASANYSVSSYDRVIVFFAYLGGLAHSQINYGGLAEVGGYRVWCNGEFDFRVIAHELGHTYGLYHGNLWQVSDGNPISPSGVDTEYGDDFDTMGANYANSPNTDFGPWFKNILGWVSDSQVITVTNSGTFRIYAFDHNNSAAAPGETLALKIVKDGTYNYWVSCRDDFPLNDSMNNGVYVQWGYNYTMQSDLLDMNTPGSSDQDAGLLVGGSFTDAAAAGGQGVRIHPLARGGTAPNDYRDVEIIVGTATPLAPTFTINPGSQFGALGQAVTFTAAASSNPAPIYQWQRQASGATNWSWLSDNSTYSGSGTTNLSVAISAFSLSGDHYRCVAYNSQGSATSAPPALLTINLALVISTLAGQTGTFGTNNGQGTNATFYNPWGIICDPAGNIYVAQYGSGMIRKITPYGAVSSFVSGSSLNGPEGLAMDAGTNLYVCDSIHDLIQQVSPAGIVTPIAGKLGTVGSTDGTNTTALFSAPWGIAVDSLTNVFVSEYNNHTIRKVSRIGSTTNWAVITIAGLAGLSGSADGTNNQARFYQPAGLACDPAGNLYVADSHNYTIRKITKDATGTNWVVSTVTGQAGITGRNDGLGTNALFGRPYALAADPVGNIYVTDVGFGLIRVVSTNGLVTTLAGSSGSADGFYTAAGFNIPRGIAIDSFGNIYVSDTSNHTIRVGHIAQVIVPYLNITTAGTNRVLSWPVPMSSFRLIATTNLAAGHWITVTNPPLTITNCNVINYPPGAGKMFYRLVNP